MEKSPFYENFSDLTSFSKLHMEKSPFFENLSDEFSLVSISFFILLKNIELSLHMMYIVHFLRGFYTKLFLGLFFRRLKLLSSNFPRLRTFF